jgi:hypothetical protein
MKEIFEVHKSNFFASISNSDSAPIQVANTNLATDFVSSSGKHTNQPTTLSLSSPRHSTMAPYAPDADIRFDTGVGDVEVDLNGITQDSEISTSVDQEARCDEERDINLVSATSNCFLFDD